MPSKVKRLLRCALFAQRKFGAIQDICHNHTLYFAPYISEWNGEHMNACGDLSVIAAGRQDFIFLLKKVWCYVETCGRRLPHSLLRFIA
jgi:hypothetical protein